MNGRLRVLARLGVVGALAAVGVVTLAVPSPAVAAPAQGSGAAGTAPPTLTLVQQPVAVAADASFPVLLDVTGAPAGSYLSVDIYPRAEDPSQLDTAALVSEATFESQAVPEADGAEPVHTAVVLQLYRSGQEPPATAYRYPLDEAGVYPLRIRLLDGPNGNRLTSLDTAIIRLPAEGEEVAATDVALLTTVHADPPGDPEARLATDVADAALVDALDPVLDTLAAHPTVPATFAVTPDTAERLAGDGSAAATVESLRTEVGRAGRDVLDAPYVDVDPSELAAAGLDDELGQQRDLGRQTLRQVLGREPTKGTWAIDRPLDEEGLDALRGIGTTRVLLRSDTVVGGDRRGPSRLAAGASTVEALVVGDDLRLDGDDEPVPAAHRLFARLALAAGPEPAATVLRIDPATVDPTLLGLVLDGLAVGTPFFAAAPLGDLFDIADVDAPPGLVAPTGRDLGSYPTEARRAHATLASYRSMVAERDDLTLPFERPLALSAAADLSTDQRTSDVRAVTAAIEGQFAAISIPEGDKVTLGARDAEFPLPISSELDYPVRVLIELQANDRVEFPTNDEVIQLTDDQVNYTVRLVAKAPGDTPVRITVKTPDGQRVLAESRYSVRSTAVSGMGLFLTIGAGGFLALWWGRHWYRNRRVARHARHRRRHGTHHPDDDQADQADQADATADASPSSTPL